MLEHYIKPIARLPWCHTYNIRQARLCESEFYTTDLDIITEIEGLEIALKKCGLAKSISYLHIH